MNIDWWIRLVEGLQDNPVAQAIIIALATFIMEDPVTISSGLLVSHGQLSFITAFLGLTIGIALGDLGLYGVGRFLGDQAIARGWLSKESADKAQSFASGWNLFSTVFASRFIPLTRIPTFVGAGVVKAPPLQFFAIALGASSAWSFTLLMITLKVGDRIGPMLGQYRVPVAIIAVLFIILLPYFLRKSISRKNKKLEEIPSLKNQSVNSYEFWSPALFYIPVAIYYLMLSIKYRSFTLPSCANPSIYSGGLLGESKAQILNLLPKKLQKKWVPPFALIKSSTPAKRQQKARLAVTKLGLMYPLVAKPDEGQRGDGVQLIQSEQALDRYAAEFPASKSMMVQEYCPFPNEAGIFYVRKPGSKHGKIISITLKDFPFLIGDGVNTIEQLIDSHPRFLHLSKVFKTRLFDRLHEVLRDGETIPLVFSGNHCKGAIFRDGKRFITPELEKRTHEICSQMPGFFFGRMDIRYENEEDLWKGQNFQIIEVNGAGSEATHIWDPNGNLIQAYRDLFYQFRLAFMIGDKNRRMGHKSISPFQVLRDWYDYQKVSKQYPMTK